MSIAVVFDLDGTLIDSAADIVGAANDVLTDSGFEPLDPQVLRGRIGLPAAELFAGIPDVDVAQFVPRFRARLAQEYVDDTQAFHGAAELLEELRRHGCRVGVATTKPTGLANRALAGAGLIDLIDVVQGSEDLPTKPDPAVVLASLDRLGVRGGWMVGDRTDDVVAGQSAGLCTIAVAQGAQTRQALAQQKPTLLVDAIGELRGHLSTITALAARP